jgi:hypothetical protein
VGGCSWIYEPYPVLSDTTIPIAEVPPRVLKSFRNLYPYADIEDVVLHKFHSKHAGFQDYNFRFRKPGGEVTIVALDGDGDIVKHRSLPPNHPAWDKGDGSVTSSQVVDKTVDDQTRFCPIHNVKLTKSLVRIIYGLPGPNLVQEAKINKDLFPYAKVPILGGCIVREEEYHKVWICRECCKAREVWLKETRE